MPSIINKRESLTMIYFVWINTKNQNHICISRRYFCVFLYRLLWFEMFQLAAEPLDFTSLSSYLGFSGGWLVVRSLTVSCLIAPTGRHLSEQSKQAEHLRPQTGPEKGPGTNNRNGKLYPEKKVPQGNFRICNKIERELIYVTGLKWPLLQSQRWRSLLKSSVIFPKFDQLRAEN